MDSTQMNRSTKKSVHKPAWSFALLAKQVRNRCVIAASVISSQPYNNNNNNNNNNITRKLLISPS